MVYPAWEREHDDKLLAALDAAQFVERDYGDRLEIEFAHLRGEAWECDSILYWKVSGILSGEKALVSGSPLKPAMAYARAALRNEMTRIAQTVRERIAASRAAG